MAKFWSVNLTAHRQPLKCDNHDKHVLENCLMSYEKEKKKSIAVLATVTTMRKYVSQMQPRSPETQKELTRSAGPWVGFLLDIFWRCCHKTDWIESRKQHRVALPPRSQASCPVMTPCPGPAQNNLAKGECKGLGSH